MKSLALPAAAMALVAVASFAGFRDGALVTGAPPPPENRPLEVRDRSFVSSDACRSCHPAEHASWHVSYHRTMTTVPAEDGVLGDFEDVVLEHLGDRFTLAMEDGRPWVTVERRRPGSAPSRVRHEVVMATGSHHYQAYWYESGRRRGLNLLPHAWSVAEARWAPIDSFFVFPPGTRQVMDAERWNVTCQKCHATASQPRVGDPEGADTRVAELGIACEACHGPGEEHVRAHRDPTGRWLTRAGEDGPDPTIVNPARLPAERSAEVCGQCHAVLEPLDAEDRERYLQEGTGFRPGERLADSFRIVEESPQHFWDDGLVRVSGREFSGMRRSPCYEHGDEEAGIVTCLSCHELHPDADDPRSWEEWRVDQLSPEGRTDAACTACHEQYATTAAAEAHSGHDAQRPGGACVDCHMPYTTWGVLKAIRSHSISSPDVRESLSVGRPNACSSCHLDRPLAWAAEQLEARWGLSAPPLPAEHREVAAGAWWALRGDAGQRALMSWALGWDAARETSGSDWMLPYLAELAVDPYDAVRVRAGRSLAAHLGVQEPPIDPLGPALERSRARSALVERWAGDSAGRAGAPRPAVLLDEKGRLDEGAFQRLLAGRDHRPVSLAE